MRIGHGHSQSASSNPFLKHNVVCSIFYFIVYCEGGVCFRFEIIAIHYGLDDITLKGVTGNVWTITRDCSIIENFFRLHLRPMRCFYDGYFFSKSANAIFKILIDCPFCRDDFENRFYLNYSMTTKKNVIKFYSKLIRCLRTG